MLIKIVVKNFIIVWISQKMLKFVKLLFIIGGAVGDFATECAALTAPIFGFYERGHCYVFDMTNVGHEMFV